MLAPAALKTANYIIGTSVLSQGFGVRNEWDISRATQPGGEGAEALRERSMCQYAKNLDKINEFMCHLVYEIRLKFPVYIGT